MCVFSFDELQVVPLSAASMIMTITLHQLLSLIECVSFSYIPKQKKETFLTLCHIWGLNLRCSNSLHGPELNKTPSASLQAIIFTIIWVQVHEKWRKFCRSIYK